MRYMGLIMEAVKTNVIGTENILTAAIEEGVEAVICLSTDKAAYPINAMGITKYIGEKMLLQRVVCLEKQRFVVQVMCLRGSVIPL